MVKHCNATLSECIYEKFADTTSLNVCSIIFVSMTMASPTYISTSGKYLHASFPTLIQIKAAIPNRLFEAEVSQSFYYVIKDLILIAALFIIVRVLEITLPTHFLFVAFPVYWYLQGTLLMGLFVLGHDCGHGSFSKYEMLNDVTGTVLHSLVLTPYYPWKISHRNHHKNTGNIDKDEVFYPVRKQYDNGNNFLYLFGLGLGWFVYLFRGYYPRNHCHFNPIHSMYVNHVTGCTLSIAALIGWLGCLGYYACSAGIVAVVKYYVIPEIVFASWLLIVTFLHHIEEDTPWYSGNVLLVLLLQIRYEICNRDTPNRELMCLELLPFKSC